MGVFRNNYRRGLKHRILSFKNLRKAYQHIRRKGNCAAGSDGVTLKDWSRKGPHNALCGLQADLMDEICVKPVHRAYIREEGKQREISMLCVDDRITARAYYQSLSEIFDSRFHVSNFGYRPRRHRGQAAEYCQQLIRSGCKHWVKADIKDCFGSIRRRRLNKLIEKLLEETGDKPWDSSLMIRHLKEFVNIEKRPTGIIQGGSLSPFFSNLYLDSVDRKLASEGLLFAHFGDDFIVGCRSKKEARRGFTVLKSEVERIGLALNDKTRIVSSAKRINFCGYAISRNEIRVGKQSEERMLTKAKRLIDEYTAENADVDWLAEQSKFLDRFDPSKKRLLHEKIKFAKSNKSLVFEDGIVRPKYLVYLESWLEQFAIASDAKQCVMKLCEYWERKVKS
ncbi:MAG: reverse transcriptase domain-containing protein [Planctomycetota bacterium]